MGGGRILLLVCGKLLRVHSLDGSVTRGHFEKEKTPRGELRGLIDKSSRELATNSSVEYKKGAGEV